MTPAQPASRSDRRTIIITGAGIGGLTAALALAEAGYRIVIAERSAQLSEAGAGIQIAPNAGRVLAGLGLDAAIAAKAIEPAAIDIRSGVSGNLLTSIPSRAFRDRYGFPYRVIHRADLQAILVAAVTAHPAITIELNATIGEHHVKDDGLLVRIRGESGGEVLSAAAVIGADGVRSACRETMPASGSPSPTGRTAWRAIVAADVARDLVAMDRVGLWLGPDAHLVHYPVTGGAAVNIVAIVAEQWEKPGWSAAGDRAGILRRFAGWAASARKLIAAPLSWQKFAILTVDAHGAWSHDRFALLGDAAHAMAPFLAQGAAMAIEDAAVLADRLHGATDIPAALREYEVIRKKRVIGVAAASEETGRRYHDTGIMAVARDTALRLAGVPLILGRSDWIYRWTPPERGVP